jgi:hypothetical protein
MSSSPTCEICLKLKQLQSQQNFLEPVILEQKLGELLEEAKACGGICLMLLHGIQRKVSPQNQERTHAVYIGGGRGSPSHMRVSGADETFENFTFSVEFFTDATCMTLCLRI